ncbi:hypothetical protein FGG08_007037 [Glutinoglossum americanum]|uniref:Extracellular membrane protein CFEM domain-containing protein n=1 Tax=Glutinoglossum americanum TaxID=1670608 RepID=A0A9P8KWU8_9PEZI|nr:hypothetical protein FGG08_007037 [Glutinoglossum americanum]
MFFSLRLAIVVLATVTHALLVSGAGLQPELTASIVSTTEYLLQLSCVQNCIWHQGAYDDVVDYIGCGHPYLNGCVCSSDLASSATSFLSSCISASCVSKPDAITHALSVYSVYCNGDASVLTTSDSGRTLTTSTTNPTATTLSTRTSTSTTSAPQEGLGPAAKAGIGTGVGAGVVLLLAAIALGLDHSRKTPRIPTDLTASGSHGGSEMVELDGVPQNELEVREPAQELWGSPRATEDR